MGAVVQDFLIIKERGYAVIPGIPRGLGPGPTVKTKIH